MKRDLDLIREILLVSTEIPQEIIKHNDLTNRISQDSNIVVAHLRLLEDRNYISNFNIKRLESGKIMNFSYRLTDAGFDFIDKIRDETRFKEVKNVADKVKDWSFDTLKEIATQIAVKAITGSI